MLPPQISCILSARLLLFKVCSETSFLLPLIGNPWDFLVSQGFKIICYDVTCYSVPRATCSLSFVPRILEGYAGANEAKATLDHSPICFSDIQVLFIIVSYLVLVIKFLFLSRFFAPFLNSCMKYSSLLLIRQPSCYPFTTHCSQCVFSIHVWSIHGIWIIVNTFYRYLSLNTFVCNKY